ncbi:MAG: ECF transporter S component [Coprobacillaceae bacterium]
MNQSKTKNMVLHALFIAIEMLLIFVPFLGYIPIGPLRATTLHIPVIIAGIVLGKKSGAMIGLVFGLSSLIYNTINPTITSFVFSPFISGSIMSAIIAIVPRILIGFVAGFIFEKLKTTKCNEILSMSVSSFIGAITNTVLVLGGIYLLFGDSYATAIGKNFQELLPYLITIVTTQGILEAVVGTIVAVLVSKVLIKVAK